MKKRALAMVGLLAVLGGCQAPPQLINDPSNPVTPTPEEPFPPTRPVSSAFIDPRAIAGEVVSLPNTPPPITGGTLFVTHDGETAIVSDPDRDRIVVVDLVGLQVAGQASLPAGAEPFRAAEDANGTVHVVLRGTGDVFSFAPRDVASGVRHHVCAMPRGIAYDADHDQLAVACRAGNLVTLGTDGTIVSSVEIGDDLRDVVIANGHRFVSTFRTAELQEIDIDGRILSHLRPQTSAGFGGGVFAEDGTFQSPNFEPAVAWRTVAISAPGGTAPTVGMVHQRASSTAVEPQPGGYGQGGGGCGESGIVQTAVTFFRPDGSVSAGTEIPAATLPVDMAVSPDGQTVTIIAAGNESGQQAVQTFSMTELDTFGGCLGSRSEPTVDNAPITNPVAAAYDAAGRLLVQQREPSQLVYMGIGIPLTDAAGRPAASRFDTGHAVFHANSGAFIACASCHPEGGDDGRTWDFDRIGPRRTPALHGELRGTEPFHWDGDMADLNMLVQQVFMGRMSGPTLDVPRVDALGNWLDAIPAPVHESTVGSDAVARGRALFEGEALCAACHSGELYTNNATVDVGTGGRFQVPSLIGVSDRLPVMHTGCAPTLRARLVDPACGGGDQHGHTSQLTSQQVDDLVAYMNTL
jgi:mono/diheme cytochrome c family protein